MLSPKNDGVISLFGPFAVAEHLWKAYKHAYKMWKAELLRVKNPDAIICLN